MQRYLATTILTLLKPVLALTLLLNTAGCRSPGAVIATHTIHDTLFLAHERYDSIYLSEQSQERYQTSTYRYDTLVQAYFKVDTIFRDKIMTEFRYKLLHDTTYIHRTDTIPKVITVTKAAREPPRFFLYILFFTIVIFLINKAFFFRLR